MRDRVEGWSLEYVACFTVGSAILALELLALRMFAPRFGASSYVAGITINAILVALALGYALGGYLSDRYKSRTLAYLVILVSAAYLTVVFASYGRLLDAAAASSVKVGVTVMVLVMFFVPMALLAVIPPYCTGMIARNQAVGRTAGRIYALSTIGSFCGGLLATFVSIPVLGSRATFSLVIASLLAIAVLGLMRSATKALAALLLLLCLSGTPRFDGRKYVYRGESEYNIITITRANGRLYLKLNDSFGYHSESLAGTMLTGDYYDYFLFPQMLTEAKETLILGNGAGTSMTQIGHFFQTRIDGVEIDPKLTGLGKTYFGLKPSRKARIFHEDARTFVNRNRRAYDVIIVDVYAGGPYVPFHVTTVEFYREVRRSLAANGLVAVNVPFYSIGTELGEYFLNTIAAAFPGAVYRSGCVAYAFASETGREAVRARLERREFPPALKELGDAILSRLDKVEGKPGAKMFTDDRAPVETMIAGLLDDGTKSYPDCNAPLRLP